MTKTQLQNAPTFEDGKAPPIAPCPHCGSLARIYHALPGDSEAWNVVCEERLKSKCNSANAIMHGYRGEHPYAVVRRWNEQARRLKPKDAEPEPTFETAEGTLPHTEPQAAFWLVWNPAQGNPTVRHKTLAEATNEAERIAAKHPGEEVFVLQAVRRTAGEVRTTTIQLTTL
jgi:hypothetical protein